MQFDFNILKTAECWRDATQQVFFTTGAVFGSAIVYASHNRFDMPIVKSTVFICVMNGLTSFLACLVVYGTVGMLSYEYDSSNLARNFDRIASNSGQGLVFVVYPAVLSKMGSYSLIVSCVFFVMLVFLGMGCLIAQVMVVNESVAYFVKSLTSKSRISKLKTLTDSNILNLNIMIHFILVLPLITKSGNNWLTVMNNYCGFLITPLIAISEFFIISFVYDIPKFVQDIEEMVGYKLFGNPWLYKIIWTFLGPIFSSILLYSSFISFSFEYAGKHACWLENFVGVLPLVFQIGLMLYGAWKNCHKTEKLFGLLRMEDGFFLRSRTEK